MLVHLKTVYWMGCCMMSFKRESKNVTNKKNKHETHIHTYKIPNSFCQFYKPFVNGLKKKFTIQKQKKKKL